MAKKNGLGPVLTRLSQLSKAQASLEDFSKWSEEVSGETNDRGAAVLVATNVENALKVFLSAISALNRKCAMNCSGTSVGRSEHSRTRL